MKAGEDAVQESAAMAEAVESAQDAPRWTASGVETYVIQCNLCFKWRVVPSKERYEAFREHILEKPFVCVNAQEWRRNTSCDDSADLDDDEPTVLWAIDRHNIPRTPEGFYRKISLRSEGATQFADVYYKAPCGKTLRSGPQAQKYLDEHPELKLQVSQFSFKSPRGRDDNTPVRTGSSSKRLSKNGTPPGKKSKANQGQPPRPQPSNGTPMHHSASKLHDDDDRGKPSKVGSKGASNLTAVQRRRSMLI